jgi:anti-anti-sigma regulatory factor
VFNVKREEQPGTLILRLAGEINETVSFDKEIGKTAPDTVLNCKEVSRINSLGVKAWVRFFQDRVLQGTKLRLVECSPAVVEQINLIMNFTCGGKVESIYVPFVCTVPGCRKALVGLFKVEDLKRSQFKTPTVTCTKCGGNAVFDDLPEEYFRFASRPGQ